MAGVTGHKYVMQHAAIDVRCLLLEQVS